MTPLAQRIADAVGQNSPHLYCFACLAAQQGIKEHDVRAAALGVIMRGGLQLVHRVCSRCHRSGEALAPGTSASVG
jgi:cytochrome c5